MEKATLGGGCFWCVEAIFQNLKGVEKVESGYSGGSLENPSYRQVTTGTTGHAEVVQITYDPSVITFPELLEVFWKTHNPTTLNRQGADVGSQYRSVVFYHTDEQKEIAEKMKEELNRSGAWDSEIVTEISPYQKFYLAEEHHQNYYNEHTAAPYCTFVIQPKIEKLKKGFANKLRS